jgi:hypothetical protein
MATSAAATAAEAWQRAEQWPQAQKGRGWMWIIHTDE